MVNTFRSSIVYQTWSFFDFVKRTELPSIFRYITVILCSKILQILKNCPRILVAIYLIFTKTGGIFMLKYGQKSYDIVWYFCAQNNNFRWLWWNENLKIYKVHKICACIVVVFWSGYYKNGGIFFSVFWEMEHVIVGTFWPQNQKCPSEDSGFIGARGG